MGFNTKDLGNINLDDYNFDTDDPKTIIHVRLSAGVIATNNARHLQKL